MVKKASPTPFPENIQLAYGANISSELQQTYPALTCLILELMGIAKPTLENIYKELPCEEPISSEVQLKQWGIGDFKKLESDGFLDEPGFRDKFATEFFFARFCEHIKNVRGRSDTHLNHEILRNEWEDMPGSTGEDYARPEMYSPSTHAMYKKIKGILSRENENQQTVIIAVPLTTTVEEKPGKYCWHLLSRKLDGVSQEEALAIVIGLQLLNERECSPKMKDFITGSQLNDYFDITGRLIYAGEKTTDPRIAERPYGEYITHKVGAYIKDKDGAYIKDEEGEYIKHKEGEYKKTKNGDYIKDTHFAIKAKDSFNFTPGTNIGEVDLLKTSQYIRVKTDTPRHSYTAKNFYGCNHEAEDLKNFCWYMAIIMSHTNGLFLTLTIPNKMPNGGDKSESRTLAYMPSNWTKFITETINKQKRKGSEHEEYRTPWEWSQDLLVDPTSKKVIYNYNLEQLPDSMAVERSFDLEHAKLESHCPFIYLDCIPAKIQVKGGVASEVFIYLALSINKSSNVDIVCLTYFTVRENINWKLLLGRLESRGLKQIDVITYNGINDLPSLKNEGYPYVDIELNLVNTYNPALKRKAESTRKEIKFDANKIYSAASLEKAVDELERWKKKWGKKYPSLCDAWDDRWDDIAKLINYTSQKRIELSRNIEKIEGIRGSIHEMIKSWKRFSGPEAFITRLSETLDTAVEEINEADERATKT